MRCLQGRFAALLILPLSFTLTASLPTFAEGTVPTLSALGQDQLTAASSPKNEYGRHVSRHYLYSNERRHDIFYEAVRGLGQGYVGVGSDQNYTLAAAQKAEVVWLLDLDAEVMRLHQLYGAVIHASPTPESFVEKFSGKRDKELEEAVAARISDEKSKKAAIAIYKQYGPTLHKRLRRTLASKHEGVGNWLSDPALYDYVRALEAGGRIHARIGDLQGPSTMTQIAEAAKASKITIRVLYLSNAESWFSYSPRFAKNVAALPFDDKSVVLRTIKSDVVKYATGDVWHFSVQGGMDFAEKLNQGRYGTLDRIMADLAFQEGGPEGGASGKVRGLSYLAKGTPKGGKPIVEGLVTRPAASPEGSIPAADNPRAQQPLPGQSPAPQQPVVIPPT